MNRWFLGGLLLLGSAGVLAQADPVAERQARNAALERVSPVMEREQNYEPSEQERVSQSVREVSMLLTELNAALDDLELVGHQHEQAKLLLTAEGSVRDTLVSLLELQAKRTESIEVQANESFGQTVSIDNTLPVTPAPVTATQAVEPRFQEIVPIVVRTYDEPTRPAKVILKIGERDPAVYYVGGEFDANDVRYTISQVDIVGQSPERHKRPIYEITLLGSNGERKRIQWD